MNISLFPFAPENLVSRDGFGSPVPRQPAHLHTQAESGAYLRDFSRVLRRRAFTLPGTRYLFKPPYAIGSVPSLSGHAIAYRWRSLPRVRRHRASILEGSSEQVLPRQVAMCVCVCVFFPFILDIKFVGRTSRGHTGFLIHLLPAVRALIFLARRIQPFLSLIDREVEFLRTNDLIVLHPLGIFSFSF